jgi:hypothetical protein
LESTEIDGAKYRYIFWRKIAARGDLLVPGPLERIFFVFVFTSPGLSRLLAKAC